MRWQKTGAALAAPEPFTIPGAYCWITVVELAVAGSGTVT